LGKRARFVIGTFPDDVIRRARQRNRHHRHSLALLVLDPWGEHIVCGQPESAKANGAAVLVPPQQWYDQAVPVGMSARTMAHRMTQSLLAYRVQSGEVSYLGYGFGNRHIDAATVCRRKKYIHWFAHVVPHRCRVRGFHRVLQDVPAFSDVQWLRIQQFRNIHSGGAVSDEKLRLVMQALWVLTRNEQLRESPAAQIAGRYLAPELIPITT
jgi:hypothetical protein